MPRSRINGNFIDKTFSVVANILLQIIPTTSGEKEAFTYYRDGVIWFFFFSWSYEKGAKFEKIFERNLRLLKVKFGNRTIPSVVYPRLMQPQILCFYFDSSIERKVTPRGSVLWVNPIPLVPTDSIREEALHPGINNTKTLFEITPFLIGLGTKRMVGTTSIHLVRTLDTHITIQGCWSD